MLQTWGVGLKQNLEFSDLGQIHPLYKKYPTPHRCRTSFITPIYCEDSNSHRIAAVTVSNHRKTELTTFAEMKLAILLASALPVAYGQVMGLPENWPTEVVPGFMPKADLNVAYGTITINSTNAGVLVPSLASVANLPTFSLTPRLNGTFIIFMIDPDAPTPQNPTSAQILHYLQPNVTGNAGTGILLNASPATVTYRGSGPPAGSDAHRYIFVVYQQPSGFRLPDGFNASQRAGFDLDEIVQLTQLEMPVAGAFFTAKRKEGEGVAPGNNTSGGSGAGSPTPAPENSVDRLRVAGWTLTGLVGMVMTAGLL